MKATFLYSLLVVCCLSLKSQSSVIDPPAQLWWLNFGLGDADVSTDGEVYFSGLASFTKPVTNSLLLTGRGLIAEEFRIFGDSQQYWEGSVIAGVYTKGKVGFASIGAGLGVTGGRIDMDNSSGLENFTTIGLPVESQLFLTLPFAGIGVVGFANFSPEGSYWGAVVALQFGNLR
jgi:hypothetical protein